MKTHQDIIIAPSLLASNFGRFADEAKAVEKAGADWLHLDVMDGVFVPNITFGADVVKAMKQAVSLPLDVHLMIEKPERHIEAFAKAGAKIITVHAEACPHLDRTLQSIRDLGCLAGVALNPSTPASAVSYVLDKTDLVLVMTVNPGFGGQSYIVAQEKKISNLRAMIADRPIYLQVDGGIAEQTIEGATRAGARALVAGSAIYSGQDETTYKPRIETLRTLAERAVGLAI